MKKEEHRLSVLQALLDGRLDVREAAAALQLTVRQVYRLQAIARREGIEHVLHRGRGRTPPNKIPDETWARILRLARDRYPELNDYELQEVLAREHDIHVSRESLRKKLRAEGIAPRRRRDREYAAEEDRQKDETTINTPLPQHASH